MSVVRYIARALVTGIALGTPSMALADTAELLKKAMVAWQLHDADAAIFYLSEILDAKDLGPNELAAVRVSRGSAYAEKADAEKAIADFNAAVVLKPDFGEAYIDRGLIWAKNNDFDKALSDFTEAARVDPKFAFLAVHDRASVHAARGEYQQELEDETESIRLRPNYAAAFYGRANGYAAIGELEKARADYDSAIQLNPSFAAAYTNRGALHMGKGDYDKAIADLDAAVRLTPRDAAVFANRGIAYFTMGQFTHALDDLAQAVQLQPQMAAFYVNRGIVRFYSGQGAEAVEDLTRAADLNPGDGQIVIWLHYVRARLGQDDGADFRARATKIVRDGWPVAVIGLYLGELKPEVALTEVPSGEPERTRRNCTKSFYLATFFLQSPPHDTQKLLQAAVQSCAPGSVEYAAAKAELASARGPKAPR